MFARERQNQLLRLLEQKGRLTAREIHEELGVSAATIRRDLAELAEQGRVVRTHGGVIHPAALQGEPVFQQRVRVATAAKQALAAQAVTHVPPSATIYIDSGTCALAVAQRLLARRDVTLLTPSIPLLMAGRADGARIIATGGDLRVPSQSLIGSLALSWMNHLRFDIAFIGASGLAPREGARVTSLEEAAMKQAAMARAGRVILVAEKGKWDKPAAILFSGWSGFHVWITDKALSRAERQAMAAPHLIVETVGVKEREP